MLKYFFSFLKNIEKQIKKALKEINVKTFRKNNWNHFNLLLNHNSLAVCLSLKSYFKIHIRLPIFAFDNLLNCLLFKSSTLIIIFKINICLPCLHFNIIFDHLIIFRFFLWLYDEIKNWILIITSLPLTCVGINLSVCLWQSGLALFFSHIEAPTLGRLLLLFPKDFDFL